MVSKDRLDVTSNYTLCINCYTTKPITFTLPMLLITREVNNVSKELQKLNSKLGSTTQEVENLTKKLTKSRLLKL